MAEEAGQARLRQRHRAVGAVLALRALAAMLLGRQQARLEQMAEQQVLLPGLLLVHPS